jgi:hypothetical protein
MLCWWWLLEKESDGGLPLLGMFKARLDILYNPLQLSNSTTLTMCRLCGVVLANLVLQAVCKCGEGVRSQQIPLSLLWVLAN